MLGRLERKVSFASRDAEASEILIKNNQTPIVHWYYCRRCTELSQPRPDSPEHVKKSTCTVINLRCTAVLIGDEGGLAATASPYAPQHRDILGRMLECTEPENQRQHESNYLN